MFIFGCGYLGRRLASRWRERGAEVGALVRTESAAAALATAGVAPILGDLDQPAALPALPIDDALVYYLVPPPAGDDTDPRLRAVLAGTARTAKWVLASTTGVYGNCGGAWVDEAAQPRPTSPRSRRRLDAEQALRQWARERRVPAVILRLAGIYGPDRLPLARLAAGTPMVAESDSPYTNRIHVEDLVETCLAAAHRGRAGAVYNICDGSPSRMTHYFNAVADAFGLARPPSISVDEARRRLSPEMLSYLNESRRLDNRALVEELGVRLKYPNVELALLDLRLPPRD